MLSFWGLWGLGRRPQGLGAKSLYWGGGVAPIFPLPFRPQGTGRPCKAETPFSKHLLCEVRDTQLGILLWLGDLFAAGPFRCCLVKMEYRFDYRVNRTTDTLDAQSICPPRIPATVDFQFLLYSSSVV